MPMTSNESNFRLLPALDRVLQAEALQPQIDSVGLNVVKQQARAQLQALRAAIANGEEDALDWIGSEQFLAEFCQAIANKVQASISDSLVPVINLTGTVIHTNLGRSKLPAEAVAAIELAATQATNLEFDLDSGARGDRDSHLEGLLCELTGAEAATVVNNNAAAVLLVLNTLAAVGEVLISRGELVEIGGAFRIPDVMKSAGCTLIEVGTTNRTHLADYEKQITEATALLMKVHTSNFEIRGFTKSVSEQDMASLAEARGIPFVSDLGSGTLIDLKPLGLPYEPTVRQVLEAGADLVTFSGDKLLGGPQAGLIVGSRDFIQRVKSNPLKRALRVDKITLAGLVEVLKLYLDPDRLLQRLPLLRDLTRDVAEIEGLANALLPQFEERLAGRAEVEVRACKSQIGSGALPLELLDSFALVLTPIAAKGETDASLLRLAAAFRQLPKPVIGRIHDGSLYFDLRCLGDSEELLGQLASLEV